MNGHEDDGDDRWSGSVSGPQTLILAQDQAAEQLTGTSEEMYRRSRDSATARNHRTLGEAPGRRARTNSDNSLETSGAANSLYSHVEVHISRKRSLAPKTHRMIVLLAP